MIILKDDSHRLRRGPAILSDFLNPNLVVYLNVGVKVEQSLISFRGVVVITSA